jgi:hypothetical protein
VELCVVQTKIIVPHPFLHFFKVTQYTNLATDKMIASFSKFYHVSCTVMNLCMSHRFAGAK